jgi:predicted HTH transcriptional regulator
MSVDPAELLATQETINLEFKRHGKDRDKISKAICALSNDLA